MTDQIGKSEPKPLDRNFFEETIEIVAPRLLGCRLFTTINVIKTEETARLFVYVWRHSLRTRLAVPLVSPETGNVENRRQDPRRNGVFSIDDGFQGSVGLDGGVRSQIRTGLHRQFPAIREINREFCDLGAFGSEIKTKSPCAAAVSR
jgi:hypothetical protein